MNVETGDAVLEMHDLRIPDEFTFENSILHTVPAERAIVSFRVEWHVGGPWQEVDNPAEDFHFRFHESTEPSGASIVWSSQNVSGRRKAGDAPFSFQSDPAAASINIYANLGQERNGVFYP